VLNLKTFIVTHWITDDADEMALPPPTDLLHLGLTSLTVHHQIPIEYLSLVPLLKPSLLLLTPSLVYLNLVSDRSKLDTVFDGDFWQTFIQTNLPLLDKFEFIFAFELRPDSDTLSLESIIAPFRKPFWLNDKGWLVTCDYVMNSSRISLHSIPDYRVYGKIFRCEASLMNGVRFLDQNSENRKIDNDSKHVCVKFFLKDANHNIFYHKNLYQNQASPTLFSSIQIPFLAFLMVRICILITI
jgi:hypothetical protein